MHIFKLEEINNLSEKYILENLSTVVPTVVSNNDKPILSIDSEKLIGHKGYDSCMLVEFKDNLLAVLTLTSLQLQKTPVTLQLVDIVNKNTIDTSLESISVSSLFDYGNKETKIKRVLELTKSKKSRLHFLLNVKYINENKLGVILSDLLMTYNLNCNSDDYLAYNSFFDELQTLFPLNKTNFKQVYERYIINKNVSMNKFLLEKLNG